MDEIKEEDAPDWGELLDADTVLRDTLRLKAKCFTASGKVGDAFNRLYEAALMRQMADAKFEQAKSEIISQLQKEGTKSAKKSVGERKASRNAGEARPESCVRPRGGPKLAARRMTGNESVRRSISTIKHKLSNV